MPRTARATLARLDALEEDFAEIERLSKELRRRLAHVAECVRTSADEIRQNPTQS